MWERLPSIESSDSRVMLYGDTTGTESIARGFYDFASEIDDDINLQMMTINSYTILMAKRGESTVKLTIDEQGYPDLYTNYILPGACRVERTTLAPRAPHIVMGGAITYGDANMKRVGQSWNKPRGETRAIVKNFVDLMRQLLDSTDSSRIKS
ncbi:MAG: hypothetical protein Q4A79_01425 [Candidatus Saccharibacteria bacterium]|nr:hypothetical protein [Candidatus Saccharibacteria bacterium]